MALSRDRFKFDDEYEDTNFDCVLGITKSLNSNPSPIANNDATIMSVMCGELIAMWKAGGLGFEAMLDRIEEMGEETTEDAICWMEIQYVRIEMEREMSEEQLLFATKFKNEQGAA